MYYTASNIICFIVQQDMLKLLFTIITAYTLTLSSSPFLFLHLGFSHRRASSAAERHQPISRTGLESKVQSPRMLLVTVFFCSVFSVLFFLFYFFCFVPFLSLLSSTDFILYYLCPLFLHSALHIAILFLFSSPSPALPLTVSPSLSLLYSPLLYSPLISSYIIPLSFSHPLSFSLPLSPSLSLSLIPTIHTSLPPYLYLSLLPLLHLSLSLLTFSSPISL